MEPQAKARRLSLATVIFAAEAWQPQGTPAAAR